MALLLLCKIELKTAGVNSAAIRGRPWGAQVDGPVGDCTVRGQSVREGGRSHTYFTTDGCTAEGQRSWQVICTPQQISPSEMLAVQMGSHVFAIFSFFLWFCFSKSQFLRLVTTLDGSRPAPMLLPKLMCLFLSH